jgi:hypothetical protein
VSVFKKKGSGGNASGGSGVRCTAAGCRGGWVEFKVTRTVPERDAKGNLTGREIETVGRTNEKCGVCGGTGWA